MSESGSRWEPDEQPAAEPVSEVEGPFETDAARPPQRAPVSRSHGHMLTFGFQSLNIPFGFGFQA